MNQPELGKLINEIRNKKGVTQKELSESCNIDIRTIQRIESGEVVPRYSTLKLIADFLAYDFQLLNGNNNLQHNVSKDLLLISFVAGILNIINWFFYVSIIPIENSRFEFHLVFSIAHLLTTVFFYTGFFVLGRKYKNLMLQITSVIIVVLVPIMVITDVLGVYAQLDFLASVIKLLGIILGINGIILGIAMLLVESSFSTLWKVGGVFQILVNPLFIIPFTVLYRIGFYISIPSLILFVVILFVEYKNSDHKVQSIEPVMESV